MNDYEQELLHLLEYREIKATANRLTILRAMQRGGEAVSMGDLERWLPTIDKSTISRTLALFLEHRLIHVIDDGSGALKYAVCPKHCECLPEEEHTHFFCTVCHKTFCLPNLPAPVVRLPEGFRLDHINYVIKGLCPQCNHELTLP